MLLASNWVSSRLVWVWAFSLFAGVGCASTGEAQTSRAMNEQMDRMTKMDHDLRQRENPQVVRSQIPPEPPATTPPISLTSSTDSGSPGGPANAFGLRKTEAQVRIVANVGSTPIYESEVREAVSQRMVEFAGSPESERRAKGEQFYYEELRRIVERELLLEEMYARLKSNKAKVSVLEELEEVSRKEADRQIKEFRARIKIPNEEDFQMILQGQGVTLAGMRRQLERSFMMRMYLKELMSTKISSINLADMRDYYDEHASEFKTEDRVKWQDIFLSAARYPSRDEMKRAAHGILQRAQRGEDFMKLAQEFDQGLGKGVGDGETRGEIRPLEAEPLVFKMKPGELSWFELETGIHIIRVADRLYAGRRPFDEKTQTEIRRKLQSVVSDREYARIIETLWRRNPPQIYAEK
jgi:peptidyl-prolyl cis-trans isomerase SurA